MSKENNFENFDLEETKVNFDIDQMFSEEVVDSTPDLSDTTNIDEPWEHQFEDEDQEEISRTGKLHHSSTSLYTKIIFGVIVLLALAALLWLGAKALNIVPGSTNRTQSVTVPVVQKLTIQSTESSSETTQETTQVDTIQETTQSTTVEQVTTVTSTIGATVSTGSGTYTVKAGDTLYGIARAHSVTVADLQSANGSAANNLQPGQILTIPSSSSSNTASSSSSSTTSSASTHTVKAGDTLYSIATRNGLTVAQLKALNGLSSNNVAIGTVLRLK